MRTLLIVILAVNLAGLTGCSRHKESGNYQDVKDNDAAMNAAIAKAKATANDFVQAFHAKKAGTSDFCVKKPYPTPDGSQEHMWIEVSSEENGVLKGMVTNEAEDTREVKMGEQVT